MVIIAVNGLDIIMSQKRRDKLLVADLTQEKDQSENKFKGQRWRCGGCWWVCLLPQHSYRGGLNLLTRETK